MKTPKWDKLKTAGKIQFNLPVISDKKMENICLELNSGALMSCQNLCRYGFMVGLTKWNIDIKKTEGYHRGKEKPRNSLMRDTT